MGKVEQNLLDKAERIKAFMKDNPRANKTEVVRGSGVNNWSVTKLEKLGLVKLPAKMNASMAATYGRTKQKKTFRLFGTPTTGKKQPPTFLPGIDYR